MSGHSDHWGCIGEDHIKVISHLIPLTTDSGDLAGKAGVMVEDPDSGETRAEIVFGLTYPQAEPRSVVVFMSDTKINGYMVRTAHPAGLAGIPYEVKIDQVHDCENHTGGLIEGAVLDDSRICFFDTFFFQNKSKYKVGAKYRFALCAFAYAIDPYEHQEFEMNNPEVYKVLHLEGQEPRPFTVSFDGAKILLPHSQGDKFDYSFQTAIEELAALDFLGYPLYRLRGTFMLVHDQPFRLDLYAGKHVCKGYNPAVGDEIRGVLWLQGHLIE